MKNKTLTSWVVSGALLANLVLVASVVAVTDQTSLDQQITGGALSLDSVPSSTSFPPMPTSLTDQVVTLTTEMGSLSYSDMRGDSTTYALAVSATDFLDTTMSRTFDTSYLRIEAHIDGTPDDRADSTECADSEARTSFTTITDATSSYWLYRDTDVYSRVMSCEATPRFEITIPARTDAGVYRTTLTWSLS